MHAMIPTVIWGVRVGFHDGICLAFGLFCHAFFFGYPGAGISYQCLFQVTLFGTRIRETISLGMFTRP